MQIAEVRVVQSPAVYALCARCAIERNVMRFFLNIHKDNAAAWRLHCGGFLERRKHAVSAPRVRCEDAV